LLPGGTCILVGSARPGINVVLDMSFLQNGRIVRGVIQGDSEPDAFIPSLVALMMEGKLPVERMMTFYNLTDIDRAAADSADGVTIKPILRMPN
jgi:aryl-alcohol dehydrogenase